MRKRFGLFICSTCGRARVVDKETKSSSCPYCGNTEKTDKMVFIYECNDQETAREALGQAAGFEGVDPKRRRRRRGRSRMPIRIPL